MTLPPDWEPPRWNARPPVPCTKAMLIAWMNRHHGFQVSGDSRMGELVTLIEDTYGERVPITGGGSWPATWDCWDFVVKRERELRSGQLRLIPKEETA